MLPDGCKCSRIVEPSPAPATMKAAYLIMSSGLSKQAEIYSYPFIISRFSVLTKHISRIMQGHLLKLESVLALVSKYNKQLFHSRIGVRAEPSSEFC